MPGTRRKRQKDIEGATFDTDTAHIEYKPDLDSAGQAGDTQGLSDVAQADSQSVEELVEEGQGFEAAVISGVENAPPADVAEVKTKEVPADDVPPEYLDRVQDVDPADTG
jgi:hypothetical protein